MTIIRIKRMYAEACRPLEPCDLLLRGCNRSSSRSSSPLLLTTCLAFQACFSSSPYMMFVLPSSCSLSLPKPTPRSSGSHPPRRMEEKVARISLADVVISHATFRQVMSSWWQDSPTSGPSGPTMFQRSGFQQQELKSGLSYKRR